MVNLNENHNISELIDNCLAKNKKKIISILNENNFSNEDCITIIRFFIIKAKKLLALSKTFETNKNIDLTISSAKPPIFWKEKEITKLQIYKWKSKSIKQLIYTLSDVYRKEQDVNWDPIDQTVLANEQVIDGKGWRSGAQVEKKKLNQWFFNITKFSNELLDSLDSLDQWPNKVKTMQKNWIGKSFGCEVNFEISSSKNVKEIKCFTTRPDTLFGMSFLALSVDHPLAKLYEDDKEFLKFKEECSKNGTTEEAVANAEKIGFKTDLEAINPLDKNLRTYVAEFFKASI